MVYLDTLRLGDILVPHGEVPQKASEHAEMHLHATTSGSVCLKQVSQHVGLWHRCFVYEWC